MTIILNQENLYKLQQQLEWQEGHRQFPYMDTRGNATIGIGRNLKAKGVTLEEARMLCQNDIKEAEQCLLDWFPDVNELDEIRKSVLINMIFNMGVTKFAEFHKMMEAVKANNHVKAAQEMRNSNWYHEEANRCETLAHQMESGTWMLPQNSKT